MLLLCLFLFLNLKYVISIYFITEKKELSTSDQVNTTNGIVQGVKVIEEEKYSIWRQRREYYRFAIPYAQPPIGNLRFSSPKPLERWSGVVDGRYRAPCCLSVNVTTISRWQETVRGEEDCLYLRVFTPKEPSKSPYKDKLPVIMYVHGGGFMSGCGNGPYSHPDLFVENFVYVIPNFRLGVFGYLSTEDMECTGNWGIKDLFAALKWIQQNIKRFGGNRRKVTIIGHGSGAVNVNVILMSPKANGLIHRAILMSGSSLSFWAYQTNPKKVAFNVGETVDIKTNSTKVLIEELRKIPADRLIDLQRDFVVKHSLNALTSGLPFTPSIEPQHSEAVWTGYAYELFERGRFNVIPVMLGVTSLEFLTFSPVLDEVKPYSALLDSISSKIFTWTNNTQKMSIIAQKIKYYFFKSNSFEEATNLELLEVMSEHAFRRPMRKTAELIARCSPTYFYQFSYQSAYGYNGIVRYLAGSKTRIENGVGHGEDAAYLFEVCPNYYRGEPVWCDYPHFRRTRKRTDIEIKMSKKFAKIYTNFAKFGNPTPQPDPSLDNITWPEVTEGKIPYVDIDLELEVRENFNEERFRFWEDLYKKYGVKPYVVY